jgi:hypothetical protein
MPDIKEQIVCRRYGLSDLDAVRVAAEIMGQGLSAFTRSAAVTLARAIIEVSADLGDARPGSGASRAPGGSPAEATSWDRCWIEDARIERKRP